MRCLLLLLVLSGTAYAQAPGELPPQAVQFDPAPAPPPQTKSLASAYLVTIAATSIPVTISALASDNIDDHHPGQQAAFGIIGLGALLLGPSAGHWYVGEGLTTGLSLRVTGAAGIGMLVLTDPHANNPGLLITGGIVSVGLIEAGMIWDLVTLPRSVRRYNQRQLQLAPMAGQGTTGLSLAGTF